jgi:hypothetical protein
MQRDGTFGTQSVSLPLPKALGTRIKRYGWPQSCAHGLSSSYRLHVSLRGSCGSVVDCNESGGETAINLQQAAVLARCQYIDEPSDGLIRECCVMFRDCGHSRCEPDPPTREVRSEGRAGYRSNAIREERELRSSLGLVAVIIRRAALSPRGASGICSSSTSPAKASLRRFARPWRRSGCC